MPLRLALTIGDNASSYSISPTETSFSDR